MGRRLWCLVLLAGCTKLFGIHEIDNAPPTDSTVAQVDADTCSATQLDCDGLADNGCEANIETDGSNCGVCGHSCGSDSCGSGLCAVKTYFQSDNAFTRSVAIYNGNVVWSEADSGVIDYAPLDGSDSPALAAKSPMSPFGVMADASGFYWLDDNGSTSGVAFHCVNLPCDVPTVLATTPTNSASTSPSAGAIDDTRLYWHTESAAPGVLSVLKTGGGSATVTQGDGDSSSGMVVVAGVLYFTECCGTNNGLYSVPVGGGTTAVHVESKLGRQVVAFGGLVYGADLGGALIEVNSADASPDTTIDTGGVTVGPIAVDASGIYAANADTGVIGRVPLAGGAFVELAAGSGVQQIVTDDDYVYWTENAILVEGSLAQDAVRRVHK